jgi:pimeloyl-ACP methyl ester carboxylesterase
MVRSFPSGLLATAAGALDRAVLAAVRLQGARRKSRADLLSHDERLTALAWIRDAYGAPELRSRPESFFPAPEAISPALQRVRPLPAGGAVWDARWPSGFEPYLSDLRVKYLAHERNRTACARLYLGEAARSGAPRPAVVLVHGYMAGQWAVEERAWPVRWLYRHGLDVALTVLPFHALRARTDRGGPPPFPGSDPRYTIEGFRQAIHDIRALATMLRSRGAPSVGVMGMSLGGYTTALLATVERELAFAVPIIPLGSIADFARDQGRLGGPAHELTEHRALDAAHDVVSPFSRPPLVPPDRVLVVASERDGITPIAHAERVASHFGARLVRMPGGHLLQFGRAQAFREIGAMLRGLGIMAPRSRA